MHIAREDDVGRTQSRRCSDDALADAGRIDARDDGILEQPDARALGGLGKPTRVVQAMQMERLGMVDGMKIVRRAQGLAHTLSLPGLHLGAKILAEQLQPSSQAIALLDARNLQIAVTDVDT